MELVNLTPHDIAVYSNRNVEDGPAYTIPKSGNVARVATIELGTKLMGGIMERAVQYEMVEYGRLEGIPSKESGKMYIVSLVCALAAKGRDDLLAPYVEVRNEQGTMIGCRFLQKVC